MGCDKYLLHGNYDSMVTFSEGDETVGCLCTFPDNDVKMDIHITKDRVRSLAYLGAAIHLMQSHSVEHGHIPNCIPKWIRDGIDKTLGIGDEDAT